MAEANPAPEVLEPGEVMSDGTVYAGISPEDGKPMYAMPADLSVLMTFNEAADHTAGLDAHGHDDWRVPTGAELRQLFNHAAAIGGFDMTGQGHATWYWSSTPMDGNNIGALCQRFSDGFQEPGYQTDPLSIRCVRTDDLPLKAWKAQAKTAAEAEAQTHSAEKILDRLRQHAPHVRLMPQKGDCSPWKPCK